MSFNQSFKQFLFFVFIVVVILIVIFLILEIIQRKRKKEFEEEYNIKLKKYINIKKNKTDKTNCYELNYPKWLYANKNGSMNRVRKGNRLIFNNSFLYLEDYVLLTTSPLIMLDTVKSLRKKHGGDFIEKNKEEKEKYSEVCRKKDLIDKSDEIQSIIDKFADDPTDFEVYCKELFEKMAYNAETTPKSNDGGYDIVLRKDGRIGIVECKCYSQEHSIGRPMIQKLVGANQEIKANEMFFITTSKFSKEAVVYAYEIGVELIDGKKLIELINKYYKKEKDRISIKNSEWELNEKDIKKYYPPDVQII